MNLGRNAVAVNVCEDLARFVKQRRKSGTPTDVHICDQSVNFCFRTIEGPGLPISPVHAV
jgi:hypothetical protein